MGLLIAPVAKGLFAQMPLPLDIFLLSVVGVQAALETFNAVMEAHPVNLPDQVVPPFHFAVRDAEKEVVQDIGQPVADGVVDWQADPRAEDMAFPNA